MKGDWFDITFSFKKIKLSTDSIQIFGLLFQLSEVKFNYVK